MSGIKSFLSGCRRTTKGATGPNGIDNTYSLTRWKKTRMPNEKYSEWWRRIYCEREKKNI